jgi:hypothetical protein
VLLLLLLRRRRLRRRRHDLGLKCHGHMAALGIKRLNCRLLMQLLQLLLLLLHLLLVLRQLHLLAGRRPVGLLH